MRAASAALKFRLIAFDMAALDLVHAWFGGLSGAIVGFVLALTGGGGSVLSVPLMMYVVGVSNAHVAIGTSALAVAANAGLGLLNHARMGTVKWRCAAIYAMGGIVGAFVGSTVSKAIDGRYLTGLFALSMIGIAVWMIAKRNSAAIDCYVDCNRERAPRVMRFGLGTGALSGFFGIGGGFLVVPGLIASTGMPVLSAIGSSLVVVVALGLTTALNYAWSDFVNWPLALVFVAGGLAGSMGGARVACALSGKRDALTLVLVAVIASTAFYTLWRAVFP